MKLPYTTFCGTGQHQTDSLVLFKALGPFAGVIVEVALTAMARRYVDRIKLPRIEQSVHNSPGGLLVTAYNLRYIEFM